MPAGQPSDDLAAMAERTIAMLRDAVSAWLNHDAALGRKVCERDADIDTFKAQIFARFSSLMVHDPEIVPWALELVLASRNLERVADLATNIAEEAIFVTEARVIKHHADEIRDATIGPGSSSR